MIHVWYPVRLERAPRADARGNDLRTRLAIAALEVVLAVVFAPLLLLATVLVGLFMILEWPVLRLGAVIRGEEWPLRRPLWGRFGLRDDGPTGGPAPR
jgi:hypothetical protein